MSDSMIEDVKQKMCNWGERKILNTTHIESEQEAYQIVNQIWLAAVSDCSKPLNSADLESLSEQMISDWCAKHRKLSKR